MNRSETIWKLEELTGSHDEESCTGCSICTKIESLREKLLFNQKVIDTLSKGPEMTKSDIRFLIGKDVQLKEIRKAIGIGGNSFTELMMNWGFSKRRGDSEMAKLKDFTVKEYMGYKEEMKLNDEQIAERKGVTPATLWGWKKKNDLIGVSQRKAFVKKKGPVESITPKEPDNSPHNELQSFVNTLKREKEVMEKAIDQSNEEYENLKLTTVSRSKYNDLEVDYKEADLERIKNFEEYKKMEEAYHKEHSIRINLDQELENVGEQLRKAEENIEQYLEENKAFRALVKLWV
jgi:transcriptional regulator with XRE-family HTH domain